MAKSRASVIETPLVPEHEELICKVIVDALKFLRLPDSAKPQKIVTQIDRHVRKMQQGAAKKPDTERPDIFFGCLWGAQLARELSWEWASLTFFGPDESQAIGVFSKDRALAIYPFNFISDCLTCGRAVTIMLSFEFLQDGTRIPPLAPLGYVNVMDHVQHIVPYN